MRSTTRTATYYSLMRRTGETRVIRWRPELVSVDTVWRLIKRYRRANAAVSVHETTDRDGVPLHVVHVEHGPIYEATDCCTDIFEIPTAALTDL
ncbi:MULTISPECIES: hypothetical protein [unclassified Streptomyces]|uniref:hypothetical protein n=1 Tax=unclassified Streptomyces TaxID=2593676 RepID=UPI0033177B8E